MTTNSKIVLATCNRCGAYVLSALVDGYRVAADPEPLDGPQGLAKALGEGRGAYVLLEAAGRPYRLKPATPMALRHHLDGKVLADHGCGTKAMNSKKAEVAPVGPQRPSATSGGPQGGSRPPHALAGPQTATQGLHVPVRRARNRLFRCETCHNPINGPYVAIEHGREIIWANHEGECP